MKNHNDGMTHYSARVGTEASFPPFDCLSQGRSRGESGGEVRSVDTRPSSAPQMKEVD